MPKPLLSIIIPVLNEEVMLNKLLKHLEVTSERPECIEILVVDGGSGDSTISVAEECGVKIFTSKKGRAVQMNHGARNAKSETLYFLHADTFPPKKFDTYILNAVKAGYRAGCFRMQFDTQNLFLRFFAWLSRINHTLCRGGDQSLFINREVFSENGGFNESYLIYEDSEFIRRIYKTTQFKVLPKRVITSARKYRQKGWLKVQYHFAVIHFKNYLGHGPNSLYRYYSEKLL